MKKHLRNLLILMLCLLLVSAFVACENTNEKDDTTSSSTLDSSITSVDNGSTTKPSDNTPATTESIDTSATTAPSDTPTEPDDNTPATAEEIYNSACEKLLAGKTAEAYEMLNGISDYAPAAEKLKGFFYLPKTVVEKSKSADEEDFDTNAYTYTYNSDGNVTKINDKRYTYNADGNVISGGDLLYNNADGTVFTYSNGKLIQITIENYTTTYEYNQKGLVSKSTSSYDGGSYQYTNTTEYSYTYYTDGSVKTKALSDEYSTITYYYNENGKIVKYVMTEEDTEETSTTITQGKYGIKEFHYQDEYGKVDFSYTYDTNGALTKLEVQMDYDVSSESIEYDFTDNQLFYSENPNVIARANIITYQDIDAALEIVF